MPRPGCPRTGRRGRPASSLRCGPGPPTLAQQTSGFQRRSFVAPSVRPIPISPATAIARPGCSSSRPGAAYCCGAVQVSTDELSPPTFSGVAARLECAGSDRYDLPAALPGEACRGAGEYEGFLGETAEVRQHSCRTHRSYCIACRYLLGRCRTNKMAMADRTRSHSTSSSRRADCRYATRAYPFVTPIP